MTTIGKGGCGKCKLTTYQGKTAIVKYVNSINDARATLATCTINRRDAQNEGKIMYDLKRGGSSNIVEIYAIQVILFI